MEHVYTLFSLHLATPTDLHQVAKFPFIATTTFPLLQVYATPHCHTSHIYLPLLYLPFTVAPTPFIHLTNSSPLPHSNTPNT